MANNNLVYVKFEDFESLESKRNLLSAEMSLLNITKAMRKYHSLRLKELEKKKQFLKAVKEFETYLKKSEAELPLNKIQSKKIKKQDFETGEKIIKNENNDLEIQLREIQSRLRELGG